MSLLFIWLFLVRGPTCTCGIIAVRPSYHTISEVFQYTTLVLLERCTYYVLYRYTRSAYYALGMLVMSCSIRLSRKDCLLPLHNVVPRHFHGRLSGPCRGAKWSQALFHAISDETFCFIYFVCFFVPFQLVYLRPSFSCSFRCVNSGPGPHSRFLPAPHYGTHLVFYREKSYSALSSLE